MLPNSNDYVPPWKCVVIGSLKGRSATVKTKHGLRYVRGACSSISYFADGLAPRSPVYRPISIRRDKIQLFRLDPCDRSNPVLRSCDRERRSGESATSLRGFHFYLIWRVARVSRRVVWDARSMNVELRRRNSSVDKQGSVVAARLGHSRGGWPRARVSETGQNLNTIFKGRIKDEGYEKKKNYG